MSGGSKVNSEKFRVDLLKLSCERARFLLRNRMVRQVSFVLRAQGQCRHPLGIRPNKVSTRRGPGPS